MLCKPAVDPLNISGLSTSISDIFSPGVWDGFPYKFGVTDVLNFFSLLILFVEPASLGNRDPFSPSILVLPPIVSNEETYHVVAIFNCRKPSSG